MSIKGTWDQLYVGKKESNIISFWGNKKKIDYDDLKRIDYMYAAFGELGYIDFVHNSNKINRFEFNKKANEKILQTIELIQENNDDINLVEKRAEDLKFYERWWFIILSMFFCCAPVGLFLIWYKRKSTLNNRIFFTIMALILWGTWYYVPYNNFKSSMNQVNEAMADCQNNISGIQSNSDQSKKVVSDKAETEKEEIEYISYSVADMIADLNSNALNASEKYKDQYVEITGKLRNIDSDGKYISLDPDNDEFNLIGIQCNIKDDDQKSKVSGMTIGKTVTLKGKITMVGEILGYSLDIEEINTQSYADTYNPEQPVAGKSSFGVGDVYENDKIKIMYLGCGDYNVENEYMQPETGNKYIFAEFSVENVGKSDYDTGSFLFDCYAGNTECKQPIISSEDMLTSITSLSSGKNTKGKIFFEVPTDAENIQLEYKIDALTDEKIYFNIK